MFVNVARLFSALTLLALVLSATVLFAWEPIDGELAPEPYVAPPTREAFRPPARPDPYAHVPRSGALATLAPGRIDRLLIEKSNRRLIAMAGNTPVKAYKVALGFSPEGDKVREGDGKTPEGLFRINRRNPQSAFHLSLGINYPQPDDIARGRAGGYSPGGEIFIHGQPNKAPDGIRIGHDWTAGCVALTDAEIRELWDAVPNGATVEIRP